MNKFPYVIVIVLLLAVIGFGIWKISQPTVEVSDQTNDTTQSVNAAPEDLASGNAENQTSVNQDCVPKNISKEILETPYTKKPKYVSLDVATFGKIKIELNYADAPKTSQNFAKLASLGFYDCLTFHRIIEGFVIQGGDPEGTGSGGPGYTVPAEIKLKHTKGAIAMARTGDQVNPKRESSGSQFYIALQDLAQLDNQYSVFGQVVEGLDIVSKIGVVKTAPTDAPLVPVVITAAVVSDQ
jgi:cyclophilin family peptidyl-prolyl cis-trans isomerase